MEFILVYFPKFLMVVGALRLINKPLFSILKVYAMTTPSKSDDEVLDKIEKSATYKTLSYILDWFASVKTPDKVLK